MPRFDFRFRASASRPSRRRTRLSRNSLAGSVLERGRRKNHGRIKHRAIAARPEARIRSSERQAALIRHRESAMARLSEYQRPRGTAPSKAENRAKLQDDSYDTSKMATWHAINRVRSPPKSNQDFQSSAPSSVGAGGFHPPRLFTPEEISEAQRALSEVRRNGAAVITPNRENIDKFVHEFANGPWHFKVRFEMRKPFRDRLGLLFPTRYPDLPHAEIRRFIDTHDIQGVARWMYFPRYFTKRRGEPYREFADDPWLGEHDAGVDRRERSINKEEPECCIVLASGPRSSLDSRRDEEETNQSQQCRRKSKHKATPEHEKEITADPVGKDLWEKQKRNDGIVRYNSPSAVVYTENSNEKRSFRDFSTQKPSKQRAHTAPPPGAGRADLAPESWLETLGAKNLQCLPSPVSMGQESPGSSGCTSSCREACGDTPVGAPAVPSAKAMGKQPSRPRTYRHMCNYVQQFASRGQGQGSRSDHGHAEDAARFDRDEVNGGADFGDELVRRRLSKVISEAVVSSEEDSSNEGSSEVGEESRPGRALICRGEDSRHALGCGPNPRDTATDDGNNEKEPRRCELPSMKPKKGKSRKSKHAINRTDGSNSDAPRASMIISNTDNPLEVCESAKRRKERKERKRIGKVERKKQATEANDSCTEDRQCSETHSTSPSTIASKRQSRGPLAQLAVPQNANCQGPSQPYSCENGTDGDGVAGQHDRHRHHEDASGPRQEIPKRKRKPSVGNEERVKRKKRRRDGGESFRTESSHRSRAADPTRPSHHSTNSQINDSQVGSDQQSRRKRSKKQKIRKSQHRQAPKPPPMVSGHRPHETQNPNSPQDNGHVRAEGDSLLSRSKQNRRNRRRTQSSNHSRRHFQRRARSSGSKFQAQPRRRSQSFNHGTTRVSTTDMRQLGNAGSRGRILKQGKRPQPMVSVTMSFDKAREFFGGGGGARME